MPDISRPSSPIPDVWTADQRVGDMLKGKRGLIVGIANANSIAYGCAEKLRGLGAELAVTYLNAKAEPFVRPLAEQLGASAILPLDVENPADMDGVFGWIQQQWGGLDFVVHSIAFAPREDLHGRVVDCSRAGFLRAMDISCYSFLEMARRAEPLMPNGGALITMSYYGADKVIGKYNIMGPVKAALEAVMRYLANELGPKRIRVFAVSPGPLKTRAASGIDQFDELIEEAARRAPAQRLVDIVEVGRTVSFLVSEAASGMTGQTIYVDAGLHVMG